MAKPHHFRDPCIHCGMALDDVVPGACTGDISKAVPIGFAVIDRRHDGVEHYRVRYSDGSIKDMHRHVSERAPYYHFGASNDLVQPPRHDVRLRSEMPTR